MSTAMTDTRPMPGPIGTTANTSNTTSVPNFVIPNNNCPNFTIGLSSIVSPDQFRFQQSLRHHQTNNSHNNNNRSRNNNNNSWANKTCSLPNNNNNNNRQHKRSSRMSTGSSSLDPQAISYYQAGHENRLGDFIRQLKCSGYKKLTETCGLSLSELEAMAARQARQLETQDQLLAAKAQRLRYLKSDGEAERLQRLREKVASQEERLRKLRALRGKVQTSRNGNSVLSTDLESLRAVFNEKEKELSVAVAKVDELTRQLEDLRKGSRDQYKQANGQSNVTVELEKLRRELVFRQKLREAQATRVAAQRAALSQRQEEAVRVDRRIAELQERLHRKRLLNHQLAATIKHQENLHDLNNLGIPNKNDPKYQTLPYNTKLASFHNQQQQQQQLSSSSGSNNSQNINNYNQQQVYQQDQQQQQQQRYEQQQQQNYEKSSALQQQMQYIALEHQKQQQQTNNNSQNNMDSNNKKTLNNSNNVTNNNNNNNFANNLQLHQLLSQNNSKSTSQLIALKQQQQLPNGAGGYQQHTKLHGSNSLGVLKGRSVLLGSSNNNNNTTGSNVMDNNYNNNAQQHHQNSAGSNAAADAQHNFVAATTKEMMMATSSSSSSSGVNFTTTTSSNANGNDGGFVLSSSSNSNNNPLITNNNVSSSVENQNSGTQSPALPLRPALPPKPAKPTPPPRGSSSSSSVSSSIDGTSGGGSCGGGSSSNTTGFVQPDRTELPIKSKPLFQRKSLQPTTGLQSSSSSSSSSATTTTSAGSNSSNNNSNNTGTSSFGNAAGAGYESTESNENAAATNAVRLSINRRIEMPPAFLFPESDPPPSDLIPDSQLSNASTTSSTSSSTSSSSNGVPKNSFITTTTTTERSSPNQLPEKDNVSSKDSIDASPRLPLPLTDKSNHSHSQQQHHLDHQASSSSSTTSISSSQKSQLIEEYTLPDVFPIGNNTNSKSYNSTTNHNNNNNNSPSISSTSSSTNQNTKFTGQLQQQQQQSQRYLINSYDDQFNDKDNGNSFRDEHFILSPNNTAEGKSQSANENKSPISSSGDNFQNERSTNHNNASGNEHFSYSHQWESTSNQEFNQLESNEAVNENGNSSPEKEQQDLNGSSESNSTTNSSNLSNSTVGSDNSGASSGRRIKKGNLKTSKKEHPVAGRRVSFDPLALLLDASLEGEFDLVVKTAGEVGNPSAANDEGITALHNGICAGHAEVVRFLVEFGCDVNAQDSDGWTPLHCAASCNNVGMVKFLVERGACIFATTLSDHETAAQKCEEDEDGYGACSEYLYSIQEKLGIINGGIVYAVFDYEAQNPDELNFKEGDRLVILRKGDEFEREWWWASLGENKEQGYVPRNLLGLFPRVAASHTSEKAES